MPSVESFLSSWQNKNEVLGAMITGSRAISTSNAQSDIDILILLKEDCTWRERGNHIIDGYLIEYFANPLSTIRKLWQIDLLDNQRTNLRMIVTGKILSDVDNKVKDFQHEARKLFHDKFSAPDSFTIESDKYALWDSLDGFEDLFGRNSINTKLVYYSHLSLALQIYTKFLRTELPHLGKLDKLFYDENYRLKYLFQSFPDEKFLSMFKQALQSNEKEQLKHASMLTSYIMDKMGGFEINNWKLRSTADRI